MRHQEPFSWSQRTLGTPETVQFDLRVGIDVPEVFVGLWWEASVPQTRELLAKGFTIMDEPTSPFQVADRVRVVLEHLLDDLIEPFDS